MGWNVCHSGDLIVFILYINPPRLKYDQRGIAVVEKPGIEFGQYLSEFVPWSRTGKSLQRKPVNIQ